MNPLPSIELAAIRSTPRDSELEISLGEMELEVSSASSPQNP